MKTVLTALLCIVFFTGTAEARQRHRVILAHPDCNASGPNSMPCEGVSPSPRGERIARSGFGTAQKVYKPRISRRSQKATFAGEIRQKPNNRRVFLQDPKSKEITHRNTAQVVAHPTGCPSRAFCGCGAAVEVFGSPIRSLWLAANWFRFPRAAPAAGMVAVRRHHVFVLRSHLGGDTWLAFDANSGRHLTRIHARSIAGYTIVNPRSG